jgi:exopolysaccharide production protein ExoF
MSTYSNPSRLLSLLRVSKRARVAAAMCLVASGAIGGGSLVYAGANKSPAEEKAVAAAPTTAPARATFEPSIVLAQSSKAEAAPIARPAAPPKASATDLPPRPNASARRTTTKGLLVTAAERINLRAPEYPVLAGEYRISDDDVVSLPIVGRIRVTDMTAAELERSLAEDLQRRTGRESHVTVEIVDYKPVFVTGYVARAGATVWKPGYTVMHAESLAGGVYRPTESNSALPADSERHRAVRAASDLARVLVHLDRLLAEKAGEPKIALKPEVVELVPKVEAEQLVAAQNAMLQSRRSAFDATLKSLQRSRKLAEEEVSGLKDQLSRLDEQLKLRRDFNENVGNLVKKGLIRYERTLEEQSRIIDIEEKRTNVVVALSRVNSSLAVISRELDVMQQERAANVDMEIIRVERETAQLRIDVQTARQAFRKLTGREALKTATASTTSQPSMTYEIVRNGVTSKAEWVTPVQPGDLVVVRVQDAIN